MGGRGEQAGGNREDRPALVTSGFWRATLLSPYPLVASGGGAGVTVLLSGGFPGVRRLLVGAFIGLTCYLLAILVEGVGHEAFSRMGSLKAALVRAVLFSFAGFTGFVVGQAAGRALFLGAPFEIPRLAGGLGVAFGISAAIALLVGLPVSAYEMMKRRLADSISRLKEAEYVEKELELARTIQQRLLPPATLEGPGFAVAARCVPARHVGGDFYDVFHLDGGKLGLAVADVAGKGIGAALIMATAKAVLPLLATSADPVAMLAALNAKLKKELGPREFVALAFAVYEPANGTLVLANAGLPDPYLLRPGQAPRPLSCPGPRMPLGLRVVVERESIRVALEPRDRVVLLSDGLPEASRPDGEPLGYEALESLLDLPDVLPAEAVDLLLSRVAAAAGASPEDDATVLLLAHRPS